MSYQPFVPALAPEAYTSRPPSILSPTPQPLQSEYWSPPTDQGVIPSQKRKNVSKRGYRACLHCRMRKAKCDLGDTDAPSKPPCSRCRREMRNCVFLPTKRRKNKGDATDEYAQVYPAHSDSAIHTRVDPDSSGPSSSFEAVTSPGYPLGKMVESQPRSAISAYYDSFGTCGPECPSPSHRHADGRVGSAHPSLLSPSTRPNRPTYRTHDSPSQILTADLTNETDALEILATAAAEPKNDVSAVTDKPPGSLQDYSLVKQGLCSPEDVVMLVKEYFDKFHQYLPIFQTYRIPKNEADIAQLSVHDPFLVSALILVASRHHEEKREIHDKVWPVVRQALTDYALSGLPACIGLVEGALILAEYLPRDESTLDRSAELLGQTNDPTALIEGIESRRTWALTGVAIRAAYALGLDSIAMDIPKDRPAWKERARCVWTWCYLYDRALGLAFWTRAPQSSFIGLSNISQSGEAAARHSFPTMIQDGQGSDDACFMQSLMELTEVMTTAHDMLYPSKGRTARLIRQGTYYKFCDDFSRALRLYKQTWEGWEWDNPNLRIIEMCTYNHVRLYVSSFCFQAHVTRAQNRADANEEELIELFPRGLAASPDAVYIYESIEAADEILKVCLKLGEHGQLAYVPTRFWINFVYAGVFALKAAHSGATTPEQAIETRGTVDRACTALLECSSAPDHPTKRYGEKLRLLASKFVPPDSEPKAKTNPPSMLTITVPTMSTPFIPPLSNLAQPQPQGFCLGGTDFDLDGFLSDYTLLGENSGVPSL